MKEPLPALLTTLVYDGMDAACTASTESTSLLHHHAWHTVRGAEKLRRTNECSRTGRGPCASQPPSSSGMQVGRGRATHMGLAAAAGGTARPRCIRVRRYFHPLPVVKNLLHLLGA